MLAYHEINRVSDSYIFNILKICIHMCNTHGNILRNLFYLFGQQGNLLYF